MTHRLLRLLALAAAAAAGPVAAMTFTVHEACVGDRPRACAPRVLGAGTIGPGDAARLRAAVQQARSAGGQDLALTLSSPGGQLLAGLELGRAIRALGLPTHVGRRVTAVARRPEGGVDVRELVEEASCLSACAYAFLGGVVREVEPGAAFGLHQVGFLLAPTDAAQAAQAAQWTARAGGWIADYLREMGVPGPVSELASRTPSHAIGLLSRAERRALGIENGPAAGAPWTLEAGRGGAPELVASLEPVPGGQLRVALRREREGWRAAIAVLLPAPGRALGVAGTALPRFELHGDEGVQVLAGREGWEFLRTDRHAVWLATAFLAPEALARLAAGARLQLREPGLVELLGPAGLEVGTRGLQEGLRWLAE